MRGQQDGQRRDEASADAEKPTPLHGCAAEPRRRQHHEPTPGCKAKRYGVAARDEGEADAGQEPTERTHLQAVGAASAADTTEVGAFDEPRRDERDEAKEEPHASAAADGLSGALSEREHGRQGDGDEESEPGRGSEYEQGEDPKGHSPRAAEEGEAPTTALVSRAKDLGRADTSPAG